MRAAERRPPRPRRHASQRGYVLVTVLAALALLAVVAARLDARVADVVSAVDLWGQRIQAERELAGARDAALFSMMTRPLGPLGFGSGSALLRVDGRHYALPNGVQLSLQDERGLISVAYPQAQVLRDWLRLQGVPEADIDRLTDALADYSDLDPLRRLNGAEAPEYRAAGLPPPRNDWPLSAHELRTVFGWHERPAQVAAIARDGTAVRDGWVNPNTAPPGVLRALPAATDQGVQQLLALREQRAFASAAEVQAVSGIVVPDDPVSFHPGVFYRLRLWKPGVPGAVEYSVMFVPDAPLQPWLILETRQIPTPLPLHDASEATAFAPDAPAPVALVDGHTAD